MKQKGTRVRRVVCAAAAVAAVSVVVSQTMYLPQYLLRSQPFETAPSADPEIRIMSANVRSCSPTDLGRRSWFYRASLLMQDIADNMPDVIGFQEVTPLHYRYLQKNLRGYDNVIAYRDKSPMSEGCPVFYNAARFELLDKGSFWLSETPEKSSRDWGAAFPRVCSYVVLRETANGKKLVVFNTHLDHVSDEARIRGIGVVLDKLHAFGDLPCVLMGDLNAREDSETYRAAVADFDDAKYRTQDPPKGPTYQKWGKTLSAENIDYFLVSKTGVDVQSYRIVDTTFDGAYPSDHFPILLTVTLP